MKYYIIAGEVSGDLHASFLIKELKAQDPSAEFRVWGGDMMRAEGATIVRHINDLAFMGFVEVIANLKTILGNLSFCKKDIINYNPDCVIFVDYPGFNLKIAKFCHKKNIKNFYYISPKVWAWKKGRIKTMKKVLDKLFVIFPFEKKFFEKYNFNVEYVGNPILDEILDFTQTQKKGDFLSKNSLGSKPIIALLPGSRVQEIKTTLPIQMSLVEKYPDFEFVVAGLNNHSEAFYRKYMNCDKTKIIFNQTYSILNVAYSAVVCSGTATLETALFNVPEVVCYKANPISFSIGKLLVDLNYISLVNIILDKLAVVELLQNDWTTEKLYIEFKKITFDRDYRNIMLMEYTNLKSMLGNAGASRTTASKIIELI